MSDDTHRHLPYSPQRLSPEEGLRRGRELLERMDARRSVRFFSSDPVPREAIELAIRTASTAPSGAHKQPWTFVAVSDPELKASIREAAEAEEKKTYEQRMPGEWKDALAPLSTGWRKPFLETAPWLVVLFAQKWGAGDDGSKETHYYVTESCGIAAGLFIASLHGMGLATVTHTPSPMGFLTRLLGRPSNERPMIIFPIGYPARDATVPELQRKSLEQISVWRS